MTHLPGRTRPELSEIGSLPAVSAGVLDCTVVKDRSLYRLDFVLKGVRIAVTDADGSGSYGSTKIFDFVEGAISFLGARQDYTKFASDGTGVPDDAAFEIGVGTTAISAAADGTLGNGVNENVGQAVGLTLSSGTAAGTAVDGAKTTALNGTATALDLNLNWSGSAATVDGNGTIDVWGTISVTVALMGDD